MSATAAAAAGAAAAGGSFMSSFAPYASAGLNMLGSLISNATSNKMQKRAIEAQKQENEKAYLRNVEQWIRETEYNNPVNQIKRLVEAGLNPNLAYGNLNNTASNNSPTAVPNDVSGIANIGSPVGSAMTAANLSQVEKTKAETENIKQNTEKQKQETEGSRIDNLIKDVESKNAVERGKLQIEGLNLDNKNKEKSAELLDAQIDEIEKSIEEMDANISVLEVKAKEIGHEAYLKEVEGKWHDKYLQAIISNYAAAAGLSNVQANDIVKTQFLRMTNISADSSQKYANVNYMNGQRELMKTQGFAIEKQGQLYEEQSNAYKIQNAWNDNAWHKWNKHVNEELGNLYLLTQTVGSVASWFTGGASNAVPTIQPLSSAVGVPYN